jgi:uncharacterized protein (UPF0335 family)
MAQAPAKPPKKEEKPDPLAHVHVRAREGGGSMPALSPRQNPESGHNSRQSAAIETLNSAIQRLDALDREINGLNRCKADVFAELAAQGFDKGIVRRVMKERRIDPLVREKKNTLFEAYWAAVDAGLPAGDAERDVA